jgi:hypothetical protein
MLDNASLTHGFRAASRHRIAMQIGEDLEPGRHPNPGKLANWLPAGFFDR